MLRQKKVPSYGLHKPSGQARIVVEGRTIYLGKHGSPESYEQYARWVNKLAGQAMPTERPQVRVYDDPTHDLSVNELVVGFLHWADGYYRLNGKRTREYASLTEAVRPLCRLFGMTIAADFGPKALKEVRDDMVQRGLCRTTIRWLRGPHRSRAESSARDSGPFEMTGFSALCRPRLGIASAFSERILASKYPPLRDGMIQVLSRRYSCVGLQASFCVSQLN